MKWLFGFVLAFSRGLAYESAQCCAEQVQSPKEAGFWLRRLRVSRVWGFGISGVFGFGFRHTDFGFNVYNTVFRVLDLANKTKQTLKPQTQNASQRSATRFSRGRATAVSSGRC